MSRIGIISDIHGNFPALRAVIEKLHEAKCERIICLGDIAGYYSMINECICLLIKEDIFCLKGNHDSYLLGEKTCSRSRSVSDCITYQQRILIPEYFDWFKQLEPIYITKDFYAVHGGLNDPLDEYVKEFDFQQANIVSPFHKVFLSGHSHIQGIQKKDNILYCNPGSVGQPRDYDSRAAYAILESGQITLYRVAYDINEIAENMSISGFSDYYYKNLYYGCKIGEVK